MELHYAAISLGFLFSFHCIGMCGPIALAVPLGPSTGLLRTGKMLTYNAGRILTYGAMGALFGTIGQGFHLAGIQQWVSIGLGVFILLVALFPTLVKGSGVERKVVGYTSGLKTAFTKQFGKSSFGGLLVIGLLNGLLPCGLVYMALAMAMASNGPVVGATTMVFFGLGTVPAMFGVQFFGHLLAAPVRARIRRFVPYMVALLGVLFILRGSGLNIPYISPDLSKTTALDEPMECD